MDDLRARFRRLDRVEAPDLWNEASARALELAARPVRRFNLTMALLVAGLLLALLAGSIAVGMLIDRPDETPVNVRYENGMVVGHDECGRIVAADPSGSETREIATLRAVCEEGELLHTYTAWSADGRFMAYLGNPECEPCNDQDLSFDDAGPWIFEASTGETRLIEPCPADTCWGIDISPDGTRVSYIAENPTDFDRWLVVSRADGTQTSRVEMNGVPGEPVFSPDGSQLALTLATGTWGIYLVNLEHLGESSLPEPRLLYPAKQIYDLSWSPDGAWVAYSDDDQQDSSSVWIVRTDGSEARRLAFGPGPRGPGIPRWSPDSLSIAYISEGLTADGQRPDGLSVVWRIDIDGGQATMILRSTPRVGIASPPAWSPDGNWIAMALEAPGSTAQSGIYLVSALGGEPQRIGELVSDPAWQPIPSD